MFIIHLFPLVLGDLCSCRKTIQKMSNIKHYKASGHGRRVWGHLVGATGPTWRCPTPLGPLPHHGSTPSAKKHTPKPSPPLIPSWWMIKGRKEASRGLMTHHLVCWVLKWTKYVHTHTLLHPKGPHTEGRRPTP